MNRLIAIIFMLIGVVLIVHPAGAGGFGPTLECVWDNGDGTYLALYGYHNETGTDIDEPIGSNNKFTPAPIDRGQPTHFLTGRQNGIFWVQFDGNNLVWKLGSSTATASKNSQQCSEGPQPLLVNRVYFIAEPVNGSVILIWETVTEIDTVGFNLYRAESENGEYIRINDDIILAEGSETEGFIYEFDDEDVQNPKNYYYKLEDIDIYGVSTFHGPVSATPQLIYER